MTRWWGGDILRSILMSIDVMIFKLIRFILQGIFDLSRITASPGFVGDIYSRIYVLLGVFMVFKLSFSFFSYIVDPESMADNKEKGVGKLISNTVVMLALLVALPTLLFGGVGGEAGLIIRAQDALLPMLPRILLGKQENTGPASGESVAQIADQMAVDILSPFFYPDPAAIEACPGDYSENMPALPQTLDDFAINVNVTCRAQAGFLFTNIGSVDVYIYNYSYLISTLVGIIVLVLLIGILIDIAKRVFKLLILQMIAPVPIMSYIDPKSSKDGAFASWVKNLTSTFLEIFLKLGLVYLIVMIIGEIQKSGLFGTGGIFTGAEGIEEDFFRAAFLKVILIVGLLMFAKDAPKFIKESLGIKDKGDNSFMGKMSSMGMGAVAGAAGGLISGRGLRGALTGAATGGKAGFDNAGTGKPSDAWKKASDAAMQVRTGDPKAESGMAAALKRGMVKSQGKKEARKLGITDNSIKKAKAEYYAQEDRAKMAEDKVQSLLHSGASADDIAKAQAIAREERTRATKVKSNFDKMSKTAEAFGVSKSDIKEMQDNRSRVHRAARAVGSVTQKAGSAINNMPGIGRVTTGISNAHSARQTGREVKDMVEMVDERKFDPFVRDARQLGEDIDNRLHTQSAYKRGDEQDVQYFENAYNYKDRYARGGDPKDDKMNPPIDKDKK